ncbi:cuticle collagen 40-like isoform X3 [Canis lupus familiaris]|uniref:cuticle collagen 40-like isoform X3 n=1 Tax=Canis lupus familiaris TaxID=9615 RepID=UPI0018F74DA2|nr:cuticle collagen 40-like isoform X3 [Canis lupus familiaris]
MQIDLDVNRTFRSHTMFWDRYRVGQGALFHMLAAYSVNDTDKEQMSTGIYTPKWFLQCFLGPPGPLIPDLPPAPGEGPAQPHPPTSQARPWGPEAEARSPARPGEVQRVPGGGSGGRAISVSAPPREARSARGVDGPSAHWAASPGSSRGVVSSSGGRVCAPRGVGGAGRVGTQSGQEP